MRPIKVENAGKVPYMTQLQRAGRIMQPSYHVITTVAMDTGMGSLASKLDYNKAVAAMEMHAGRNELDAADAETAAAMNEAEYAAGATARAFSDTGDALKENSGEYRKRLDILAKQKLFFDGMMTANILSDYNEKMFQARQKDLNEHPDGTGHLFRMEQAHDSLVSEYLGGSYDPVIKHKITPVLKELGARNANRAFEDEQTRLVASATIQLQDAVNQGALYISNGGNPDDAMDALQPAADMIPDSLAGKEAMIRNAQNDLIWHSFKVTALQNPWLAEKNLNMQDGLYSALTPAQRESAMKIVETAKKDIELRNARYNQDSVIMGIAMNNRTLTGIQTKIDDGEFGLAELQLAIENGEVTRGQAEIFKNRIVNRDYRINLQNAKMTALLTRMRNNGSSVIGMTREDQQTLLNFAEKIGMIHPDDAELTDGNRLSTKAQFLIDHSFDIQDGELINSIRNALARGNAVQVHDAALAFKKLFTEARDTLPKDNDPYVQAMIHAVNDLEHGISINDMQKRLDDFMSPKSSEETKMFEKQLNEKYPRLKSEAISGNFKKDFMNGSEKYGLDIESDDTETFNMAWRIFSDAWIRSKGDVQYAMDFTCNIIRNSRAPSCINGITGTDIMMTNPLEKRFGNVNPEEIRRRVCARAAEISAGIQTKDGRIEILPPEEGKPNSCIWHVPNGLKITGTFWFENVPGSTNGYYVRYMPGMTGTVRNRKNGYYLTHEVEPGITERVIINASEALTGIE